jgi:predicted CopG family antitoxin
MTTKTISIKKDVYDLLKSIKRKNESFSDLLKRLTFKQNSFKILEKIAGTMDLGNTSELIDDIRKKRQNWRV